MTLWQQLCEIVDRSNGSNVLNEVRVLAQEQSCAEDEIILTLLNQALKERRCSERTRHCWESLSQREKQVAALVCSGLTGRQTAAHLVLSPETVKTHVRHILRKFGLNSRRDLRNLLSDWDFSRWLVRDKALGIADSLVDYYSVAQGVLCQTKTERYDGRE